MSDDVVSSQLTPLLGVSAWQQEPLRIRPLVKIVAHLINPVMWVHFCVVPFNLSVILAEILDNSQAILVFTDVAIAGIQPMNIKLKTIIMKKIDSSDTILSILY